MISGGQFSLFRILWSLSQAAFISLNTGAYIQVVLYLFLATGYKLRAICSLLGIIHILNLPQTPYQGLELVVLTAFLASKPHPFLSLPYNLNAHSNWQIRKKEKWLYHTLGILPFIWPIFYPPYSLFTLFYLVAFFALLKKHSYQLPILAICLAIVCFQSSQWQFPFSCLVLSLAIHWPAKNEDMSLFYDGDCGLCHKAVIFVLMEGSLEKLQFYPLQGIKFKSLIQEKGLSPPDSLAVYQKDQLYFKAEALLLIGKHLGGIWSFASLICGLFPLKVLNFFYDKIAHWRHRLFKKPTLSCPLIPSKYQAYFPER